MFRKYYKAANDEIKTNRELIDKIFEISSANEKPKNKVYSFGTKYGTAFAAVLVLCIVLAVYPQITKLNEEPEVIGQQNKVNRTEAKILPEITSKDNIENEPALSNNTAPKVQDFSSEPRTSENGEVRSEVGSARIVEPQQDIVDSHNENDVSAKLQADSNNEIRLAANTYEEKVGKLSNSYEIDVSTMLSVTDDEIQLSTNILEEKLGKSDNDTGHIFIFEIAGKLETEENSYYLG